MDYVRPLTEMLDLCVTLDPGFIDLENLSFLRGADAEEFVYLLGMCFCTNDFEGIKAFARSRIWCTYRKNFPAIGGTGPTSDKGWGCMLRCGQMVLAQALSVIHLGRNWQWQLKCADANYRRLLSMFEDRRTSLFSIHQIAQMGVSEGKPLGEWFGPNTIAQVLKKLVIYDDWSNLAVHVAMDNILISDDVRIMAAHKVEKDALQSQVTKKSTHWKKPLLIIVPLRLGLTVINECYSQAIKEFFKLPQCAGIVGGRPNHAVYFFGQTGNKLLYLDPHVCHDIVEIGYQKNKQPKRSVKAGSSPSITLSPTIRSPLLDENDQMVMIDSALPSKSPSFDKCNLCGVKTEELSGNESCTFLNIKDDNFSNNFSPSGMSSPELSSEKFEKGCSSLIYEAKQSYNNIISPSYSSNNSICNLQQNIQSESELNDCFTISESSSSCEFNSCTEESPKKVFDSSDSKKIFGPKIVHRSGSEPKALENVLSVSTSCAFSLSAEFLFSNNEKSPKSNGLKESKEMADLSNSLSNDFVLSKPKDIIDASYINCKSSSSTIGSEGEVTEDGNYLLLKSNSQTEIEKKRSHRTKKTRKRSKMSKTNEIKTEDIDNFDPATNKATESIVIVFDESDKAETTVKDEDGFMSASNMTKRVKVKEEDKSGNDEAENQSELSQDEGGVEDDFDDSTFHCPYILHMNFDALDPSLALAFVCLCEEDYNDLVERLNNSVLNASSPPLFEILESRPNGWPEFVPYALHDETLKLKEYDDFGDPQFDSDDQFEILE